MQAAIQPNEELVIAKAVINASDELGLARGELAQVLGIDPSQVSRLTQRGVKRSSKQWDIALYVIRIARGLFALNNGDKDNTQHFMKTPNRILQLTPKEALKDLAGLVRVLNFVDAMRGKV